MSASMRGRISGAIFTASDAGRKYARRSPDSLVVSPAWWHIARCPLLDFSTNSTAHIFSSLYSDVPSIVHAGCEHRVVAEAPHGRTTSNERGTAALSGADAIITVDALEDERSTAMVVEMACDSVEAATAPAAAPAAVATAVAGGGATVLGAHDDMDRVIRFPVVPSAAAWSVRSLVVTSIDCEDDRRATARTG
ncbi:MAG: hypothetical protein P4L99_13095 [Chthoniobacter sp.]|nr:hypothetical protein [Chthoniobacter sp.]